MKNQDWLWKNTEFKTSNYTEKIVKESIKRKRDEQETRKKAHMKISKANNL